VEFAEFSTCEGTTFQQKNWKPCRTFFVTVGQTIKGGFFPARWRLASAG
jgi:hypothetical protein